jgi:hypothetical protein
MHSLNGNINNIHIKAVNFGKGSKNIKDIIPLFSDSPDILIISEIETNIKNINYLQYVFSKTFQYTGIVTTKDNNNNLDLPKHIPINYDNKSRATVIIYVKNKIYNDIKFSQGHKDINGRYISVELKINNYFTITIWGIYGPPKGEKDNSIFFNDLKL